MAMTSVIMILYSLYVAVADGHDACHNDIVRFVRSIPLNTCVFVCACVRACVRSLARLCVRACDKQLYLPMCAVCTRHGLISIVNLLIQLTQLI